MNPADFIILNGDNFYNALNKKSEILYSFRKGKMLAKTIPAQTEICF